MAQGKLKVKTKLPNSVKSKPIKHKNTAIHRRNNAPMKPKTTKFQESQKLKKMISKTVNTAMENDLREMALEGKMSLVKKDRPNVPKK